MALHQNLAAGYIHVVCNWSVADNTARDALTVAAADVGKFCKVATPAAIFELTDDSPMTWRDIAAGAAPAAHASSHASGGSDAVKIDDLSAADDNTDLNASTTAHGLLVKATAPAAGLVNVVGIANGETAYANKALFDTTNPAALGTAAPGTEVLAARRDHVHTLPKLDDLAAPDDNTDLNVSTTAHGLAPKLSNVSTEYLSGTGVYSTPAGGSGTVTNTGGNLTANSVVLGAGTVDTKVVAGVTTDGTAQLVLGVNATSLGSVKLFGNTSGDVTLSPTAAAGTATAITIPATSGTMALTSDVSVVPANSQSAAYTAVLADAGKSIDHPSTDANARTFTIPANASVAYPVGTCISFSNMTAEVVTIAITTDTLYLASAGTTGSRSLAQYGVATARKLTSTTWLISGTGLT